MRNQVRHERLVVATATEPEGLRDFLRDAGFTVSEVNRLEKKENSTKSDPAWVELVVGLVGGGGVSALGAAIIGYLKRTPTRLRIKDSLLGWEAEIESENIDDATAKLKELAVLLGGLADQRPKPTDT